MSDCLIELNQSSQSKLKSFIFELQNLRLKEKKLEAELRTNHTNLNRHIEQLNEKREKKLNDLNNLREKLHQDKNLIDLKNKMAQLNLYEMELEAKIKECTNMLDEDQDVLNSLNTELRIKKMYSLNDNQTVEELIEAESNTIKRAKQQLEEV